MVTVEELYRAVAHRRRAPVIERRGAARTSSRLYHHSESSLAVGSDFLTNPKLPLSLCEGRGRRQLARKCETISDHSEERVIRVQPEK
jgi:hypothetical protein